MLPAAMFRYSWWRQPQSWVVVGMIVIAVYFSVFNVFRHANIQTSQFDLGNMDQVLWNTIHGDIFQLTSPTGAVHQLRTAIHADFLLLVYVPFYALWPNPQVMMILQTLAVVSGAWPLFLFARKRLSPRLAAWLSLAYVVYPSLLWSMIFDVHAVVLATPLLLWALWAMTQRRWWIYAACLAAATLSKEEVGVTVGLIGLYTAWRYRPRWIGLATAIVGIGWTMLMLEVAIPHARHIPGHFALSYYADYGGSVGSIVGHVITHPWTLVQQALTYHGADYLAALLIPIGLLPILGLPIALFALPELSVNLLSNNPNLQTIFYQYTAVITPILFFSAVIGLERLRRWLTNRPRAWRGVIIWLAAAQLISLYWWSPIPGSRYTKDALAPFRTSSYRQSVAIIKSLIRPNDKVAATNNLAPQFTQRAYEWAFPEHLELADVIVAMPTGQFDVLTADELKVKIHELERDPTWHLVLHDRDLYYFRRVKN